MDEHTLYVSPHELKPHPKRDFYHSPFKEDESNYGFVMTDISSIDIQDPLYVQKGTNIILDGHMRHSIALELKLDTVPIRYFDVDDASAEWLLISTNSKRQKPEPNPIRIARKLKFFKDHHGILRGMNKGGFNHDRMTQEDIARLSGLGVSTSYIYLNLLELINPLQDLVEQDIVGIRAANIIAKLSIQDQERFCHSIKNQKKVSEDIARAYAAEVRHQKMIKEVEARHIPEEAIKAFAKSLNLMKPDSSDSEKASDSELISINNNVQVESTVKNSEDTNVDLTRELLKIDTSYESQSELEYLPPSVIDTDKQKTFLQVAQSWDDTEASTSYQTKLFSIAIDKNIRTLERVEQELVSLLAPNAKASRKTDLHRLKKMVERLNKKIETIITTVDGE